MLRIVQLAQIAEDALRVLVDEEEQTSLATELENVRQFRIRMNLRLAVETKSVTPTGDSIIAEIAMHAGKSCRVIRKFEQERKVETNVDGFVISGIESVPVAEIVYMSDWRMAVVPQSALREVR